MTRYLASINATELHFNRVLRRRKMFEQLLFRQMQLHCICKASVFTNELQKARVPMKLFGILTFESVK